MAGSTHGSAGRRTWKLVRPRPVRQSSWRQDHAATCFRGSLTSSAYTSTLLSTKTGSVMRFLACQVFPATLAEWHAPQRSLHRFFVVLLFCHRSRNISPTRRVKLASCLAASIRAQRATSIVNGDGYIFSTAPLDCPCRCYTEPVARFSRNTTIVCFKYCCGDR
jgi:hypothetical protein